MAGRPAPGRRGKLTEAARAWVRGRPPIDTTVLVQLRQWGAAPEVLRAAEEQLQAQAQAAQVRVWPEHWHAVQVLLAMATQWVWVPCGMAGARPVGLRLEALPVVLPAVRARVQRQHRQPYAVLLQQLQQLEDAALAALAQQAGG